MIFLLFKIRLKSILNTFIKKGKKKKTGRFISLLCAPVLMYFVFTASIKFLTVVSQIPGSGDIVSGNILIILFFGFFVLLLFSGITVSIYFLFTKSDLSLLMSSPLSLKTVFSYKFFESLIINSYTYLFFCIPVLIAYGVVYGIPVYSYLYLILTGIIFFIVPSSLSVVGSLLVVKLLPAKRAKDYMTAVYGFIFLVVFLGIQFIKTSAFSVDSPDYNPQMINSLKNLGELPIVKWLPSSWAAQAVSIFIKGNILESLMYLIPLAFIGGLLFFCSVEILQSFFLKSNITENMKTKVRTEKPRAKGTVLSIILKDIKVMKRDTRLLTQNLFGLLALSVFPFIIGSGSNRDTTSLFIEYRPYFLVLLLLSMIAGQITSRSIPLEGKSFWLYKIAPVDMKLIIISKLSLTFFFLLPYLLLIISIVSIVFKSSLITFTQSAVASVFILFNSCAMGILFGALMPKFDWENPKRMLTGSGNLFVMISNGVLIFIYIISINFIADLFHIEKGSFNILPIMISVGLVFSLLLFVISIKIGNDKLNKYQWDF